MKIKTSYYANVKKINDGNTLFIQVSNSKPKWIDGCIELLKEWYPPWEYVEKYKNGDMSYDTFKSLYLDYLINNVDKELIRDEVKYVMAEKGFNTACFLCWEKDYNKCHRKILAEYLFPDEYISEC